MFDQSTHYYAEVRISKGRELDDQLDGAVENAIRAAIMNPGPGVMVTRHDQQTFSVELTYDVPYGTISERERSHLEATRIPLPDPKEAICPPH